MSIFSATTMHFRGRTNTHWTRSANWVNALAPGAIDGIEWIKLQEIELFYGGKPWELVTRQSDDYFELLKSRKGMLPIRRISAKFEAQVSDAQDPRIRLSRLRT